MYGTKDINLEAEENLNLIGKKNLVAYSQTNIGIKSDGTVAVDAGSTSSYKAGSSTEIVAPSRIGLNDGSASSVTAPAAFIQNNFSDAVMDDTEGWKIEAAKFKSITSRAPTHEPYDAHNTGIADIKPFDSSGGS